MKNQLKIIGIIFLSISLLIGCFQNSGLNEDNVISDKEIDSRDQLSSIFGNILVNGIDEDMIEPVVDCVNLLKNGLKEDASVNISKLTESFDLVNLSDVIVDPPVIDSDYYRGLLFTDIREARISLANIDRIKSDGFDTVWIQIQFLVRPDGSYYVPGEEVYLFYLNAFYTSGFRVWIAMGHSAYEFPYRFNSKEYSVPPLSRQEEAFERAEPEIKRWAGLAEKFGVDAFIPLEEANTLILEKGATRTDLYQEDRDFINIWMQNILLDIRQAYTGKTGFATNDGGQPDWGQDPENYSYPQGPDFNYTNYTFVVTKVPFRSAFDTDLGWLWEWDNRLLSCNNYAERDNVDGVIWYEAGCPVGEPYKPEIIIDRIMNETEQCFAYEKTFEYANKYNISGLFFELSPIQPHEGDWGFFGKSAEQVIIDNFVLNGIIEEKSIDKLWIALGEDGLKALQLIIAPDLPFDPDYSLDEEYLNSSYHQIELSIDDECNGYGGYGADC